MPVDCLAARQCSLALLVWAIVVGSVAAEEAPSAPPVTAPPEAFFMRFSERDRDVARKFYKKYLEVKGLPVAASAEVADEALQRTHYLVSHLLAGRPDVIDIMVKSGTR